MTMDEQAPKLDPSAISGRRLYYDKETKTIKGEPSFKQQALELRTALDKAERCLREIDDCFTELQAILRKHKIKVTTKVEMTIYTQFVEAIEKVRAYFSEKGE